MSNQGSPNDPPQADGTPPQPDADLPQDDVEPSPSTDADQRPNVDAGPDPDLQFQPDDRADTDEDPVADGPRPGPAGPPPVTASHAVPVGQQRLGLIVLAALTIVLAVLLGVARSPQTQPPTPAPTPTPTTDPRFAPEPTIPPEARTKLYSSGQAASGVYVPNTLSAEPTIEAPKANGFRVQVETSLKTDPDLVAQFIFATLNDTRGWASYGKNSFKMVTAAGEADLTFLLASPKTVDALCGVSQTQGKWDCRIGNRIVLNSDRWFYLTPTFTELADYRAYMVNRQVGFWLGQQNTSCRFKKAFAPVMANQNIDLGGCLANPWPRLAGEKPRPAATPSVTPTSGG